MKLRRPSVRVEDDRGNPVNLFQVKEMAALETGKKAAVNALGKRGTVFRLAFPEEAPDMHRCSRLGLGAALCGGEGTNRSQRFDVRLEHVYRLG
jgi:hypothetical protein